MDDNDMGGNEKEIAQDTVERWADRDLTDD